MNTLKTLKKKGGFAILAILMSSTIMMATGCGNKIDEDDGPLTLMTYGRSYASFDKALKAKYPEIEIKYVSYKGKDATDYALTQLRAHDITDIFCISAPPIDKLQSENLYDFSGEEFLNNMNVSVMQNVAVGGSKIYLIPVSLTLIGMYYNKTLFETKGWKIPNSLSDLEALCPQIVKDGCTVAENYTEYNGAPFQFFFDSNGGDYFNIKAGKEWMNGFLDRSKTATGNLEACVTRYQKLIDWGMIKAAPETNSNVAARNRFYEGNTAFILPSTTFDFSHKKEDGTTDEYGMLPFLSEDGKNNTILTLGSSYYGISNKLQNKPKKLEKALKVLEFIASKEGRQALAGTATNQISILKDDKVDESNPIYNVAKLIDEGKAMNFVQTGWDVYMSDIGQLVMKYTKGELTSSAFLKAIDDLPSELPALATIEEDLEKEDVAQLVGTAYAKATGSDLSLISIGDYHGFGENKKDADGNNATRTYTDSSGEEQTEVLKEDGENSDGINGKIYSSVTLDTNVVCTINPLGWNGKIKQMTLTGAKIKKYAEEGFFYKTAPTGFPYLIIKPESLELKDDTTYKVAISNEYYTKTTDRKTEGNMTTTSAVGQDVLINYITGLKTVNKQTIRWIS